MSTSTVTVHQLPIYTSRSEYTDEPETAGAPVAGSFTVDERIVQLKNLIFSLQEDILSQLPLEKFYAYDQDTLQDVILDIFYPIDNPEFIKNFNSHLDLKEKIDLLLLFRGGISYHLQPHLIALKAFSEVKPYLNERPQPKTFRDIYPILGKYLKENPDQVETLFDTETIQSGVGKKLDLSDDLYATLLCRIMANPEKNPSDIIMEMEKPLRPNITNFSITLQPDLKLILVLEGENFGTLQVLPPNTSLGLKFDSSLSCATWFKLVEKQKTYAQFVIALEFSKGSQWYQNAENLEEILNYFPNVEQLHLPHFNFQNNSILIRISNLKNLKNLNLEGCQFGEFTGFGKADALQKVNLSRTNVHEKHVADLAGSKALEIAVRECSHLKEEGLAKLRTEFPHSFFYS